jgi:Flp pilus assembly protein TadD
VRADRKKNAPPPPPGPLETSGSGKIALWVCTGLALVTFLVFLPVLHNEFVNYDDPDYVTANQHVQSGLTPSSIGWAFTAGHASNWHPITWISHMADWSLFGDHPAWHHFVSLLFHMANSVILFLLLRSLTTALWPSAVVAALFALHPCHVESVAWVSERKDVLSAFFGLLSLWSYGLYALRQGKGGEAATRARRWYVVSVVLFLLGLMSKPMLVTLPFVLLLVDYWPLNRISPVRRATVTRLFLEKTHFFLLSIGSSVVTFFVQRKGGAVSTSISLPARIENAVVAYARYLGDLVWPHDLAVLYPHPGSWPPSQIWIAAAVLLAITVVVVLFARKRPYLIVGWLWFLGMLVPAIGLVQVGVQSMADRYTYLPFIGLFIMAAWSLFEVIQRATVPSAGSTALAGMTALMMFVLLAAAFATNQQTRLWQNSETLFRHAARVTRGNYLAYNNLGFYLSNRGETAEAIENYRESLKIKPDYEDALNNLGFSLAAQKKYFEAIENYTLALKVRPNHVEVHNNLGNALSDLGRLDEAIPHYEFALKEKPEHADAHNNFGVVLAMKGRFDEAIEQFHLAMRYKKNYASAHSNLGNTYAVQHKLEEASAEYHESLRLNPNDPQAHNNLGNVLAEQGKLEEAAGEYRQSVKLDANNPETHFNLGMVSLRQSQPAEAEKQFREALKLKPDYTEAEKQLRAISH